MPRGVWVRDPDRGGTPIPQAVQERTAQRIRSYGERHLQGKSARLEVRFDEVVAVESASFRHGEEPRAS